MIVVFCVIQCFSNLSIKPLKNTLNASNKKRKKDKIILCRGSLSHCTPKNRIKKYCFLLYDTISWSVQKEN